VEAYETELGLEAGMLAAVHERARVDLYGEDRSHRTYVLRPALDVPHQLPPDVAGFTGRETELGKLRALVAEQASGTVVISAIAGTAGVGKTALAVHLAHELAAQFPDVQLYVNLHGYEPAQRLMPTQVLDRFLRALGVPVDLLPTELDDQAARYRGLLVGRRALVVLDNASSAEQVRPLLPASASCLVLVTSRDRLAGLIAAEGAKVLMRDVLAASEALDLLSRTAGSERVSAEPEASGAAVACPLPCESRGPARHKAGDEFRRPGRTPFRRAGAPRRALGRRCRSGGELRPFVPGVGPGHRSNVPQARTHPGPHFAGGVAAALMERTPDEAETLEALVDAHLVEVASTAGRYRFHDLVHLYAREQAEAEETHGDRESALRRMFEWYVDTADAAERLLIPGRRRLPYEPTDQWNAPAFLSRGKAMDWFEAERANLVAAIDPAAGRGFHDIAWQLADASWSFLYLRSYWPDWRDMHRTGLASARTAGNRQAEAWMLSSLGDIDVDLRQSSEEVVSAFQRSVAICREIGDSEGGGPGTVRPRPLQDSHAAVR